MLSLTSQRGFQVFWTPHCSELLGNENLPSAWLHPSEILMLTGNHLKAEMMNSYWLKSSVFPTSMPIQIHRCYSETVSLNVTNFLHVWKVSRVGTSQSMYSLERNTANLKTSITKEVEWFCVTISTEGISVSYWKPPLNGFWAPHWSLALLHSFSHCSMTACYSL